VTKQSARLFGEKKKAREDAVMLLEAARGAIAKAEERAQRTLEETKKAYKEALANAREASEETDRELRLERRMRQTVQEILRPTPPLLQVLYGNSDDEVDASQRVHAAVSHLIDLMHGKEEMRWYMTAGGQHSLTYLTGSLHDKSLTIRETKMRTTPPSSVRLPLASIVDWAVQANGESWKDPIQLRYTKRQVPATGIISSFRWQLSKHSPNERT